MASNLRSGIILFPLGFHCLFSLFQSNETNVLLLPSKWRSFWKAQKTTPPVFECTCKHLPERRSTGRDGHYEYHQQTSSGLARLLFVFPENTFKKYLQGYDRSWKLKSESCHKQRPQKNSWVVEEYSSPRSSIFYAMLYQLSFWELFSKPGKVLDSWYDKPPAYWQE